MIFDRRLIEEDLTLDKDAMKNKRFTASSKEVRTQVKIMLVFLLQEHNSL